MKMRAEQKTAVKKQYVKACVRCAVGTVTGYMDLRTGDEIKPIFDMDFRLRPALTLVVVILLYGRRTNAAFKMPWIILILAFPVLGLGMYLLFDAKKRRSWCGGSGLSGLIRVWTGC